MIGAIIGDIAGSRFEFSPAPDYHFDLFTHDCNYTDDTICTMAIADAILHDKDYKSSLIEWCRRYPNPMGGYGSRFVEWINSDNPEPNNSCGNGSAMRVSPIGWLFDDRNIVRNEAKRSAEVSHNHPEGIKGAQCVADIIHGFRYNTFTKYDLPTIIKEEYSYDIMPLKEVFCIGSTGHFDAICQETVPMAIRCFIDARDFEDAIKYAIMAGGDTHTKAAITGSMAEAFWGVPEDILNKALSYLPNEMIDLLEEYYDNIKLVTY